MSKLSNGLAPSSALSSYGATADAIPQNYIPDLSTPSSTPRSARRRKQLADTRNLALASGQVGQMRDGTSLGLEGLARHSTWLNVLLVFVPLGVGAHIFSLDDGLIFCFCFIGMIPLAMHLSRATEDIADRTNHAFGALVNVTFGNAVEIILSVSALRADRLALIQNTLVGSILSNLLLVLGSAFLWGGIRYPEQNVSHAVSESNADMLAFSVFSLSIPAIFAITVPKNMKQSVEERLSLVTSICLLILYCLYMFFQLYTHEYLYYEQSDVENGHVDPTASQPLLWNGTSAISEEEEIDEEKIPSLPFSFFVLVITVIAVAVLSEMLVRSIDGFSRRVGLGEKFIAIVLLPVVGNAVEHMSAILVAGHNKIDLAIGIACGSSVQIALFTAPMMVVISWMLGGVRLALNFHTFETVCVAFSVFVVNVMLRDSKSNWLEGAVLVMCYVIVASAFYFI